VEAMEGRRNPLRRYFGKGDLHFVTFSCHRRRPYLGSGRARNRFLKILDEIRVRHDFALVGYVVMPEHVHLLMGEPRVGNPSKSLQVLKQKVSRELRKKKRDAGSQKEFVFDCDGDSDTAFWQRRFYDFNVWNEKKLQEKLEYMHRNPVDRNLVQHPRDWPWSSWSFYENSGSGLIRMDILKPTPGGSQNPHP
jgi:putative transposase